MPNKVTAGFVKARAVLKTVACDPAGFAFVPAICLAVVWFGGELALVIIAIVLPVIILLTRQKRRETAVPSFRAARTGSMLSDAFRDAVDQNFDIACDSGLKSAVFIVQLDEADDLIRRHGQSGADHIMETINHRIAQILRDRDAIGQTGPFEISICLDPVRQLDLEKCIQMAARLQTAVEKPIALDGLTVHTTGSVGFCQHSQVSATAGKSWREAATVALNEARHHGPGSMRAYSDDMRNRFQSQSHMREEIANALESDQILPWFQPQISTDTGLVTGFEALARWEHPTRGLIPPSAFLPAIEQTGMLEALGDHMMSEALKALKAWDEAGAHVPQVGVNFAGPELNNPRLVDKVAWELDRFDLSPSRLVVEVLETVVTNTPDDTVTRNINRLGQLGCKIDLDDFGTGHASIASIRRFSVSRIKIDRSFVTKADRDPQQQRLISAILTMAERLGVETIAEGVETSGEHALLAQLGCNHVQGFGIGKPMPFEQTLTWIENHTSKLQDAPQILTKRRG